MSSLERPPASARAARLVLALAGLAACRATPPPTETVTVTQPAAPSTAVSPTATVAPVATTAPPRVAPLATATSLPKANPMLGVWRVVGCQTSPMDPADCARGEIVFEAKRWIVSLNCCKQDKAYSVVSVEPRKVTIVSEGEASEIVLDEEGAASWNPGHLGGRVGSLRFVRKAAP